MFSSIEEIIKEIVERTKLDEDEIRKMIEEKQIELSGLVSAEGAAYMVAREQGINLLKEGKKQLKIKNLVTGLQSVEVVGRVVRIFEPREFEKEGKKGRVLNILLGDETGTVRLSLWNEEIELLERAGIKENDGVKLVGGYVKTDNRDNPELRLGKGKLEKLEPGTELPKIEDIKQEFIVKRNSIQNFKEGEFEETMACLVQVFRKNPFFEVCPNCSVRIKYENDKWLCEEHGEVKPTYQLVVSGVLDDGSGNIRVVFFRELAEKIFGKTTKELIKIAEKENDWMVVYDHVENLGKDLIIRGKVKKNEFTESLELIASEVEEIDIKKECEKLLEKITNA
jgi:replication factor A1